MKSWATIASLFVGVGALLAVVFFVRTTHSSQNVIKVRWLLSHQPSDAFSRAATVFADELKKESSGEMSLSVITPKDLGLSGDIPHAKILEFLRGGDVEIASAYTVALGHDEPTFWSLNLPFLFADYQKVFSSFDGEGGARILSRLSEKTPERALAFTLSGGFRVIASKYLKIQTLGDLKGKRIATSGGPVAEATLRAFGAVAVPLDLESGEADLASIDGVETTYARLSSVVGKNTGYTAFINETNHSLFSTAIIAGGAFYNSLSPANRAALEKAARAAAAVEREDSVALNDATKEILREHGSIITTLTPDVRAKFIESVKSIDTQFQSTYGE